MSWAIILAAAAIAAGPGSQPLHLDVDDNGSVVVIRLLGRSPTAWSARYQLEVTGGPPGGSSRSVQGGTATLRPGQTVTVATVRLGNRDDERWTARLHVVPSRGAAYDLEWQSTH